MRSSPRDAERISPAPLTETVSVGDQVCSTERKQLRRQIRFTARCGTVTAVQSDNATVRQRNGRTHTVRPVNLRNSSQASALDLIAEAPPGVVVAGPTSEMPPSDFNPPHPDAGSDLRHWRVTGICLVPTYAYVDLEALTEEEAEALAAARFCSAPSHFVDQNGGDFSASYDFRPLRAEPVSVALPQRRMKANPNQRIFPHALQPKAHGLGTSSRNPP